MSSSRPTRLAVLLAAGAGTRFSGPQHKLLAPLRAQPVISHSVAAMVESGVGDCLVVQGAIDLSAVITNVELLTNPLWETGQRSSVVMALRYGAEHGYDSIIIGLGDQPFISSDAWRAVAETDGDIVVATYDGVRGNPVKLSKSVWELFHVTHGDADAGARSLMHLHPELVREVACKGISADIDTPEDLAQWT